MFFWEVMAYLLILISGYVLSLIILCRSNKTANQRDRLEQRCIALTKENLKLEHEVFKLTYVVPKIENEKE